MDEAKRQDFMDGPTAERQVVSRTIDRRSPMPMPKVVALLLSGAFIVAGVLIEGSDQNPWNLVLPYLFAVSVLEAWRVKPSSWVRFLQTTMVCGLSMYGAVWTLGAGHAASSWSSLVYIGLAGAVFASISLPPRAPSDVGEDG